MTEPYWEPLAAAPISVMSYGAAPPGAPNDGDLWVLPFDVAAGVMWLFRYRAASASAYKWEFVGGTEALAQINAAETPVAVAAWTYTPTNGPDIIIPRSGDYRVRTLATLAGPAATTIGYIAVANASVGPAPITLNTASTLINTGSESLSVMDRVLSIANAVTLRQCVYQSNAGVQFSGRALAVTPIRVS